MFRSIKRSPSIDKAPRQESTSFSEASTRVGTFITNVEITLLHYDLPPYVIDSADRLNRTSSSRDKIRNFVRHCYAENAELWLKRFKQRTIPFEICSHLHFNYNYPIRNKMNDRWPIFNFEWNFWWNEKEKEKVTQLLRSRFYLSRYTRHRVDKTKI